MTLTCNRCLRDTDLLVAGVCLDCIVQQEDERAIAADALLEEVRPFAKAEIEAMFPQDGTWTEPPDVEADAAEGRDFYSWDRDEQAEWAWKA